MGPDPDQVCVCGHPRAAHVYHEGPCRPGFVCADECTKFRRQPTLFDLAGERRARDEAVARADDHASPDWKQRARAALVQVCETHAEFCSDDIWATGLEKPREARALGAVMRWAATKGYAIRTDRFATSAQVGCHGMDVRVWKSLIYRAHRAEPSESTGP